MPVLVDDQLILHLEKLSKLKLNDTERTEIKDELFNILKMFDAIEKIDENQLGNPARMVEDGVCWRPDEVANQVDVDAALKNAPQKSNSFFVVPKFIENK
jgi:aspartyl-tRNA(Asn)/glutamyl-tRNA(Gln) amidotransferase subunit C